MKNKPLAYLVIAAFTVIALVLGGRALWGPPATPPTPIPLGTPTPRAQPPLPKDSLAPAIAERMPAPGEELRPDGSVSLVFLRPMNRASVEQAFRLTRFDKNEPVAGLFAWQNDQMFTFHPTQPLDRAAIYSAILAKGATDAQGQALQDASYFAVRVVGFLEVTQVIPAPDTTEVDPNNALTVIFNRPVVPLTTLAEQAALPQPLSFEPAIAGKGEWLNTSVYRFVPERPLIGGATYAVSVAPGLIDTVGTPLLSGYSWRFTTQPPAIVYTEPGPGATQVAPTAPLTFTFNQPIDPASAANAINIYTGFANLARIDGTVTVSETRVIFTPRTRLDFGVTYKADVSAGLRAAGGGTGMKDTYSFTFTTAPLPTILSTSPSNGTRDAYPYTDFQIEFSSTWIDANSIMPHLTFTPPLSPTQVYTYFSSYDNRFVINFGATPSTDYTVEIRPGITDAFGNVVNESRTIKFRTADLTPAVQLLVPDVVGTYNATDPARVILAHVNIPYVDLRLARINPATLQRASDYAWDGSGLPNGDTVREWRIGTDATLNASRYTPVDLVDGGGTLAPGLYLLSIDAPGIQKDYTYGRRHVLVVSAINLTFKREAGVLYVWATDLRTGAPVNGLALTLYGSYYNNSPMYGTATTDAQGVARFDLTGNAQSDSLYVLSAQNETRFTAGSDAWSGGISTWDFNLPSGYGLQPFRLHFLTDRPIYRPGQTVYFRGALRADDDGHYSMPTGVSDVHVQISAPDSSTVYDAPATLSAFGTFNGELKLGDGAALGQYYISVTFRDAQGNTQSQGATITVAAYRTPEFSVTVKPISSDVVSGTLTTAVVEVSYYFGGPVANRSVTWNVLAQPYQFDLPGAGGYSFSDGGDPYMFSYAYDSEFGCGPYMDCYYGAQGYPILSGSGTTDAQGHLTVDLPADLMQRAGMTQSTQFTIEATVSGADGQVISGRNTVTVHQSEVYVGIRPGVYVATAGEAVPADVITVGWDGTRRAGVPVTIEFVQSEWNNIFVKSDNGQGGTWTWEQKDTVVASADVITDANGQAQTTVTPPSAGSYRLRARARDGAGRAATSSTYVWVSGPEAITWRRDNNDRITLITDKRSYLPGDTAQILVPSPFQGRQYAWITVERGHIIKQEVVSFEGSTFVYSLPITTDHAPNIFVSVVLMKGQDETNQFAAYKLGYADINVGVDAQSLHVEVRPSAEKVEPGQDAKFEIVVTDANGQPVQGEFSFDLVDKSVLSLLPRELNAIVSAFYGKRTLEVHTASGLTVSVNRIVQDQLDQLAANYGSTAPQDGNARSGGGGEADAGGAVPPAGAPQPTTTGSKAEEQAADMSLPGLPGTDVDVRANFADTAFWTPAIVTGPDGHATLAITLPDNLTTWVLRGVGITTNTQVGEGLAEVVATRPLLVRPVTPRFFVVDDHVQLAALISNNTDSALDVTVTLSGTGLSLASGAAAQTVNVPANSEAKVTWNVIALDVPYAEIVFMANAGPYTDAAKPRLATGPNGALPVLRYSAPDIVGTAGWLDQGGELTELIALPPRFDDRRGTLTVRLDPSLAAGMTESLTYLEHYEYECVEQTVSRFLPNVLTYQALKQLNLQDPALEANLPALVQEGLDRLYLKQRSDGGWGWWGSDDVSSSPHMTAYVVFGLVRAEAAGFPVRAGVITRGVDYLQSTLTDAKSINDVYTANRQAFALYVLSEAKHPDATALNELFEQRAKLSHYGRAYLALAIGIANSPKDTRVTTLLSDLQGAAVVSATGMHWAEADIDWWAMNTDTRSTAIVLDAFARLDPQNALLPNVVRWLMVARKAGIWSTTQETAWSLIGLTDYMVATNELAGQYDYLARLNGTDVLSGNVDRTTVRASQTYVIALKDLVRDAANQLVIARGEGPGRLYYTAHLQAYLPVPDIKPADRGFAVSRRYTRGDCTDGPACPTVTSAQVGDVIRVQVTLSTPYDRYYVMLEDPLPAGGEAIDTQLDTTSVLAEGPSVESDCYNSGWRCWWWNWWSRSELRDDKVVLFSDYLNAGTYEYTYTFRATLPGEYRVIPSVAQEMYFPEVFGRGDGALFTINP